MRRAWKKRLLAWGTTAVYCVALAEGGSWLALSWLNDEWMQYASLSNRPATVVADARSLQSDTEAVLAPTWEEIVHPYFGVSYPVYHLENWRGRSEESLMEYGFKEDAGPLVRERSPDRVVINITGGSVARGFLDWGGREALTEELKKSAVFKGKDIVFSSTAFYGHKQPQQLLAVNYLMTLGAKFDVIVAIDGFNEITMPKVYNLGSGASPYYPWGWYGRIWKTFPDSEHATLESDTARLRRKRTDRAKLMASSPLGRSMFFSLLWEVSDRWTGGRIDANLHTLQTLPPTDVREAIDPGPVPLYANDDEYLRDQVGIWREGTRQLARISKANDIAFVSVLQPNQYAGKHQMTAAEKRVAWTEQPFKPIVEKGYPLLRDAGKTLVQEEKIVFEDATNVFDSVREAIYTDDCCHFNAPLGNELLAKRLAPVIVRAVEDNARAQRRK